MSLIHHSQQQTKDASSSTATTVDPSLVILGPRPYNRFLGNPPAGSDAEEAFKNEMGFPWIIQLNAQPLLDKIDQLEATNAQLQAEVTQLKAAPPASSSSSKKPNA